MTAFSRIFFLFLLICFFCFSVHASNDTTNLFNKKTVYYFNQHNAGNNDSVQFVEHTLTNFQNYLPRNHLGNTGLAFNDLWFAPLQNELGFRFAKNNYANYFFSPNDFKFYNTRTPYADLFYLAGTKREQIFKMIFSYNVKKNWNVTANFNRFRSDGFYNRQTTNDNFIALSSNYTSTNNAYGLLVAILYNSVKNAENGGITDDSTFLNSYKVDKKLYAINLSLAKRATVNGSLFVKQFYNLGKKQQINDSVNSVIPSSRFSLSTLLERNYWKYEDDFPLSGYYSNIYFDSTKTLDSTYNFKVANELAWKRVDNKKHEGLKDMFGIGFSIKHQYDKLKQHSIDTSFNSISVGAEVYNTYSENTFWWNMSGNYVVNGFNKNDFKTVATIKKNIIDSLSFISFTALAKQQTPDFIYYRYSSNNFEWNNTLKKTEQQQISFLFAMKKYHFFIGADYSLFNNISYFDNYAIARQFTGRIAVFSSFVKKNFSFHNWHLNNKISYQNVPDSSVVRLPELVLEHSLFYERPLLKNAMRLQIGFSVFYFSSYYANTYMPATAQFYLQNERKYGNYPFIDFFLNAQIKMVRVFIKIDHLNSGMMGGKYISTPHYPMNDRAFKIGVSWKFFD